MKKNLIIGILTATNVLTLIFCVIFYQTSKTSQLEAFKNKLKAEEFQVIAKEAQIRVEREKDRALFQEALAKQMAWEAKRAEELADKLGE